MTETPQDDTENTIAEPDDQTPIPEAADDDSLAQALAAGLPDDGLTEPASTDEADESGSDDTGPPPDFVGDMLEATAAWPVGKSLAWLRREKDRNTHDYAHLCAKLAARSGGYLWAPGNANQWAAMIPEGLRRYSGTSRAGDTEFWLGGTYGHVARSIGGGNLLCNDRDGYVRVMPVSYYSNIGPHFWVPAENAQAIFGKCTGTNPDDIAWPPEPAGGWPLRPGNTYPDQIPILKQRFNWQNVAPGYGQPFADRIKQWQQNHGMNPDGLIRRADFRTLTGL